MDYQTMFGIASNLILLPLLSLSLLVAYLTKKEYMKKSGFDKPEIGIIIVGSIFGLVADIPLIISGDSLLNINLGGALIPLIVCGSFIYKKKLNVFLLIFGTAVVSVLAFMVTRIEPGMGIVSEFPWFFLPSVGALSLAFVFGLKISEREFFSIPYAYTIAVLGNLIGADLLRIPGLLDIGILGSLGGAGARDLVYLSGLIASVPLVFLYYREHPISPPGDLMDRAKDQLKRGDYAQSRELALKSVVEEVKKACKLMKLQGFRLEASPISTSRILQRLGFEEYALKDYLTLCSKREVFHHEEARKDFLTGKFLREEVRKRMNELYTSLGRRAIAFVIDTIILTIPFAFFLFFVTFQNAAGRTTFLTQTPVVLAVLSLAISIHFIYFTIFEWYFGTTIGKLLFGLRVLDEDFERMSFVQSAARNSGRYADMLLGFYILSIILIIKSPERKRIGDYIAGTRVVKIK
ncbi:MAG: RDD family protein [Candidatus Natronoplasma sp.]